MIVRVVSLVRRSLIWRTIMFANLASLAVTLVAGTLAWRSAEERFEGLGDLDLWDQAHALQEAGGGGLATLDALPQDLKSVYTHADSTLRFALVTRDGTLKLGSAGVSAALAPTPVRGPVAPYFAFKDAASGLVGRGLEIDWPADRRLVLQVGQDERHADVLSDSVLAEFVEHFGLALLLGIVAQVVVTTLTIRATLRPLANAAQPRAGERLPTDGPLELAPMVARTNGLLDGLEKLLGQQRRFTADAAHQLRTPLARLAARIEVSAPPHVVTALRPPLEQLQTVVSKLLDAAAAETLFVNPDGEAELAAIARAIAGELAPGAIAAGVDLALSGAEACVVHGDPVWIAQALRNLVENAIRHAPARTTVEIEVGTEAVVTVRDRGPGVAPDDLPHLFERFWRGAATPGPGAGLGLSIVESVMKAHGGGVSVENLPDGGACFRLHFPAR